MHFLGAPTLIVTTASTKDGFQLAAEAFILLIDPVTNEAKLAEPHIDDEVTFPDIPEFADRPDEIWFAEETKGRAAGWIAHLYEEEAGVRDAPKVIPYPKLRESDGLKRLMLLWVQGVARRELERVLALTKSKELQAFLRRLTECGKR